MKSHTNRLLIFILILTLVSLACGRGSQATQPPATSQSVAIATTQKAVPTQPSPTATTTAPKIKLGPEKRYEEGGYAYQEIPGWTSQAGIGITTMLAVGADPDLGPSISLFGGAPDSGMTAETMIASLGGSPDITLGKSTPITIGGYEGLSVDITIQRNGKELAGRMVAVVTPDIQFGALAGAPRERWDNEVALIFEAFLKTITLFPPVAITEEAIPTTEPTVEPTAKPTSAATPEGQSVSQYAVSATASSSYGSGDSWKPAQATGKPNVNACGDDIHAWASSGSNTVEWIELLFTTPVLPTQVNIYETFTPDQVVKVEILDSEGKYHEIYTAQPQKVSTCPYVLSIPVTEGDYLAVGLKITIDQTVLMNWLEIDAVQLIGISQGTSSSSPSSTSGDVIVEPKSGLPMLADGELLNSDETTLLYSTNADLTTLREFYLTHLPEYGWLLDIDEKGKCRDNDRCMGWHGNYDDLTTTTFFFLKGDHAYLTLNFLQDGSRWQVVISVNPEYK